MDKNYFITSLELDYGGSDGEKMLKKKRKETSVLNYHRHTDWARAVEFVCEDSRLVTLCYLTPHPLNFLHSQTMFSQHLVHPASYVWGAEITTLV